MHWQKVDLNIRLHFTKSKIHLLTEVIWLIHHLALMFRKISAKSLSVFLGKHFSKTHCLYKLFNHNKINVSYRYLQNFKSAVNSYNKNILNK